MWMTSEVFKLKGLSEQVRNDYIISAEERLEVRLSYEAAERAQREAEEKVAAEAAAKEAAEKVVVEVEAKGKIEAGEALATEATHKAAEDDERTNKVALTRG